MAYFENIVKVLLIVLICGERLKGRLSNTVIY